MISGKYINISWFLLLITGWWLAYPSEKYEFVTATATDACARMGAACAKKMAAAPAP